MRYAFIITLFFLFNPARAEEDVISSTHLQRAHNAIKFCINQFKYHSGNNLHEDIDRVIVRYSPNRVTMLFTHGELGIFSKMSNEYEAILFCDTSVEEEITLNSLGRPLKEFYVENHDLEPLERLSETIDLYDFLFLRDGNDFNFAALRLFNERLYERLWKLDREQSCKTCERLRKERDAQPPD